MKENNTAVYCPSCEEECAFLFPVKSIHTEDIDQEFFIYRCTSCDLSISVPFGIDPSFYSNDDYGYERFKAQEFEKKSRNRFYINLIKKHAKEKVIDVGCMFGLLLDGLEREFCVHGIELAQEPCMYARKRGLSCFNGTVQEFSKTHAEAFDTVVSIHTIEHTDDARSFLSAIREILTIDGTLILSMPNFGNNRFLGKYWGWNLVPAHQYHFNKRSISYLLDQCGFTDFQFYTKGGDASFLLSTIYNLLRMEGGKNFNLGIFKLVHTMMHLLVTKPLFHVRNDELIVVAQKAAIPSEIQ
jgi:SAM-dependent methyltransferase